MHFGMEPDLQSMRSIWLPPMGGRGRATATANDTTLPSSTPTAPDCNPCMILAQHARDCALTKARLISIINSLDVCLYKGIDGEE